MPCDERLVERIRRLLKRRKGIAEKRMFGGVAFLAGGHMCCGVTGARLVLRLGNEGAAEALAEPHTKEMDFTGRTLASMVYVEPRGTASEPQLRAWVERGLRHARSLPPR